MPTVKHANPSYERTGASRRVPIQVQGFRKQSTERTTMSIPQLPPEMVDYIVDHLHDIEDALRNCCLVSKSWIPCTRKHLFANTRFPLAKSLQSWKETFPDPLTSPACYTKTLSVDFSEVATAADAETGDWMIGFSRVEHLVMDSRYLFYNKPISLVPFHGFSPATKSLRLTFTLIPLQETFNLILSFPFLEDLAVISSYSVSADSIYGFGEPPTAAQPLNQPMFTGSLELNLTEGTELFIRRLLSLPGGIHFRELTFTWIRGKDLSAIMTAVERCSHTLESLNIHCDHYSTSIQLVCPHR